MTDEPYTNPFYDPDRPLFFDLEANPLSVEDWGHYHASEEAHAFDLRTEIAGTPGVVVSSVYVGLDMALLPQAGDPPLIFETAVFVPHAHGPGDPMPVCLRSSTVEDLAKIHERVTAHACAVVNDGAAWGDL